MKAAFLALLFVVGACMGSFACCTVRRLRLKELGKSKSLGPRSVCLSCGYQLKFFDNLPIISWLWLKGKCRKCHHKIGVTEILAEVGFATAFLMLGNTIDLATATALDWAIFAITLLLTFFLGLLALYDGTYGELPTRFLIVSGALAVVSLILQESTIIARSGFTPNLILNLLGAVAILGGIYLVLYLFSKGKWVGDGDWILGLIIALALGDAWLALIVLFLANLFACLVMLPYVKKNKQKKIYFGPFMVIAYVVVVSFSTFLQSMIL